MPKRSPALRGLFYVAHSLRKGLVTHEELG